MNKEQLMNKVNKLLALAGNNPSQQEANAAFAKAQKLIGKRCLDCSGLISSATGILRGSYNYRSTATECVKIGELSEKHVGWGLWCEGHIGVYIGNGKCIEARGIDYGTVQTNVKDRPFTHVIKLCDIDYGAKTASKEGWNKEEGIWRFYENGTRVRNKWIKTEAGYWYYLDEDGNLKTGWVKGKGENEWYYCNESINDDLIGKMVTNSVILFNGKNYYLGEDGKMITEGHVLTFDVDSSGAMTLKAVTEVK